MSKGPIIFLVAGEASGDGHGAELISALRRQDPSVQCVGTGGARMKAAGQDQLFDLTEHAVVGLVEVLKHYPQLRGLFAQLVDEAERVQPDVLVLIDYPGFNLRLAKVLRRKLPNTKIVYFISPQVWAWKSGRAKTMSKLLDLLLVIFPFEKDWFAQHAPNLRVEWVGHPIWDRIVPQDPTPGEGNEIALLPGSREGELRKHLPILVEAARELGTRRRGLRFIWISPDAEKQRLGLRLIEEAGGTDLHIESYVGYPLTHLSRCALALLASGTVSLECAFMGVPQIVFYKVNPITYWIGRRVIKVPYVSMVNVLAGTEVVPEYIQHDLDPVALARRAESLLGNSAERSRITLEMRHVVERLGEPGACERAAALILAETNS